MVALNCCFPLKKRIKKWCKDALWSKMGRFLMNYWQILRKRGERRLPSFRRKKRRNKPIWDHSVMAQESGNPQMRFIFRTCVVLTPFGSFDQTKITQFFHRKVWKRMCASWEKKYSATQHISAQSIYQSSGKTMLFFFSNGFLKRIILFLIHLCFFCAIFLLWYDCAAIST